MRGDCIFWNLQRKQNLFSLCRMEILKGVCDLLDHEKSDSEVKIARTLLRSVVRSALHALAPPSGHNQVALYKNFYGEHKNLKQIK